MERTASGPHKIAIFSSGKGRGSNLAAIHGYFSDHHLQVKIALAIFTRSDSPAYHLAQSLGISSVVIPSKNMQDFERQALELILANQIDLIALAGFMKLLSHEFITAVRIPILNVHPALLPKFGGKGMYGMAVHEAVFAVCEEVSGATIHRVDHRYDHGKIIAQQVVDISACKSAEEISRAVLKAEHELYAPSILKVLEKS
jgi:folate-dependent phosphoribosylglycinamide formyltransferase PurN